MKAPKPDGRGPSTNSPPTEAKPSGRRLQKKPAQKKRKKKDDKKGPPQHWKYVSYADIRQIIAKTEGVPKEAVEALTVAFFLCAKKPSELGELWSDYKGAMIKLAEWVSKEGGPYIMNHIDGVERAFSEPFMGATLIPRPAGVDCETGVGSETSRSSAGVDNLLPTSNNSAELAIAAYREAEKWAARGHEWQEKVVAVPNGKEGDRELKRLIVLKDAAFPWDLLPGRDGKDQLRRRPKPSHAACPSLIRPSPGVGVFMYWGKRVLVESGCRSGKPSERVFPKTKREPETEEVFAINVLNRLTTLLYTPPQGQDAEKDDGLPALESQERDAEMDEASIFEEDKLRDPDSVARQANGRGDEPGTDLNTMREVLEAVAVEFKKRSWWIPDDRK